MTQARVAHIKLKRRWHLVDKTWIVIHFSTLLGVCYRPSCAVGERLARPSCDLCEPDLLDRRSARGHPEWTPGREGVPRETDEPSERGRKEKEREEKEGGGRGGRGERREGGGGRGESKEAVREKTRRKDVLRAMF